MSKTIGARLVIPVGLETVVGYVGAMLTNGNNSSIFARPTAMNALIVMPVPMLALSWFLAEKQNNNSYFLLNLLPVTSSVVITLLTPSEQADSTGFEPGNPLPPLNNKLQ